ncbi:Maf family protein [Acanthopleuribacter pedis]|uniref:dTTP/UTP pyrophosphatase n=1 Tax=Acanthopleuribacter pedis TaxID=442870 RepID=A0A8J7U5U9_9BACT|nr:Maf family protein [Acanthopleuribacter pedis]MBO1319686.1 Maf family protein [Acanthopleuribacter pedis]
MTQTPPPLHPVDACYLLLASQSPRRSRLLQEAGYAITVVPSHADEEDAVPETVTDIVVANARIKGRAVIQKHTFEKRDKATVLVAADTLVAQGARVYSKPADIGEAHHFLNSLGGRYHQVHTGVFLYHFEKQQAVSFFVTSRVLMRGLDFGQRRALFREVNPLDKAGAYGYQDSKYIVAHLDGSESNVIGLPMERLAVELAKLLGV